MQLSIIGRTKNKEKVCDLCKSSGKQVCDHCFKCGSSEHFARGCKTLQETGDGTTKGQGVAKQANLSHSCTYCKVKETNTLFKQCSNCRFFTYCSESCQQKHWNEHKTLCKELNELDEQKLRENFSNNDGVYACHLTPREDLAITWLVGKRCTVQCSLNGMNTTALWDTGAQVSIVYNDRSCDNSPNAKIQGIEELLGVNNLDLKAVNGTALPYSGWTEIDFSLIGTSHDYGLKVPFLVCKDALGQPVTDYNVIKEITRKSSATSKSYDQLPFHGKNHQK